MNFDFNPKFLLRILFLLCVFVMGCQKDPEFDREHPLLVTTKVERISSHEAKFYAEISFREKMNISEYGFIWDDLPGPHLRNSVQRITFEENTSLLSFSATVTGSFSEDTIYFVRSYLKAGAYTVYGNELEL